MFTILVPMTTMLDEPVTVSAVFAGGTVRPVWFHRRGTQIQIREIGFTWKTREGNALILHFSVTDGQGTYELRFNAGTFTWRLAASA
jgi:hypothetical protein